MIIQLKKRVVAVLYLDLDDFKKVNDTLGHETGDKLLIEAADRLRGVIRSGDTVGRLGGDEFIILLGGLEAETDIIPVVETLLNQFRKAFDIDGREMLLTLSVGISVFPIDGKDPSELLRNADSAMYHAKESGRNTYSFFTDAMNAVVSMRLLLEEQLHGALERDEFSLAYQPLIDIESGLITGAEALLRWNNAALGTVAPDEFIPVTEQTGLIITIGQFVLREALQQARQWQLQHAEEFSISVNLSPRQFRDPRLVESITDVLNETGFHSHLLKLEITEGVLMSGHSYIETALQELNELGVIIAMGDFGTGYSSLSYVRHYPFDLLKIDRSFVADLITNQEDRELINAIISMAHSLNLKVVAEGVETSEQLACLKELECDMAQGYLLGKPMQAEALTSLLNGVEPGA